MNNSALLVMDVQAGIIGRLPDGGAETVAKINEAIVCAREKNITIIFVVVAFRNGAPEVSSTSTKSFAQGKVHFATLDMEKFSALHPGLVSRREDEVVVTKKRISAFTGSDLEVLLRAYSVRHLILTGFTTSGVVLSTLCEAADKDFQLTVLSDCCQDPEQELHDNLMSKVYNKRGDVMTVSEWVSAQQSK